MSNILYTGASSLLSQVAPSVWLPEQATASNSDDVFRLLLIVGGGAAALVILAFDILLVMNLRRDDSHVGEQAKTPVSTFFFVQASALLLAVLIFLSGFNARVDETVAPGDAYAISAAAADSGWTFTYSNSVETDTLRVPSGQPVVLNLTTESGARNVWVPQFRLRETIAAGAESKAWFEASQPGNYPFVGTRLDGSVLDLLSTEVVVHEPSAFREWLMKASNPLETYPLPEAGRILADRNGCFVCHSTDGSPGTAPSFLGLLSRSRAFVGGGSMAAADSAYVRESILTPQAKVVEGFQPVMPSFDGKLGDPEIGAILEYFRVLEADAAATEQEAGR